MINLLIAECPRQALEPLELISRLAGLVKVLETDRFSGDGKVRRFPIAVISNLDTCTQSGRSFPDLVPNQDERLMVCRRRPTAGWVSGGTAGCAWWVGATPRVFDPIRPHSPRRSLP